MEKMKLNYKEENIDLIVSNIKASPFCAPLIASLGVTDQEIKDNYDLFLQYMNFNSSCIKCKKAKECDHSTPGYQYILKRDFVGNLTDGMAICDKFKNLYHLKNNLLYTTFEDEFLFNENYKNFLKDNLKVLGDTKNIDKVIKILKNEKINGIYFKIESSTIRRDILFGLSQVLLKYNKCGIVSYTDLVRNLQTKYKGLDIELFNSIKNLPLLVIDGIGNETITTFSRDEVLIPLIDYRLQHELTTIITSQYNIDELASLYKITYNDALKAKMVVDKIQELVK